MEALMKLVADSFARHGIECPASNSNDGVRAGVVICPGEQGAAAGRTTANSVVTAHGPNPVALPEHNYRKSLQGDPAP
jgi:hypothetical protein